MELRTRRPARIALVGDRSPAVQAHTRIPTLIETAAGWGSGAVEGYWLHSTTIAGPEDVGGFDGVWVVPGSPYESLDGVLAAVQGAREMAIPFFGTCGGFQHMLLEFARNVCGLSNVGHAEVDPAGADLLIAPLECSLIGQEDEVFVTSGTLTAQIMGAGRSTERFFCRYGLNPSYRQPLADAGMVYSATDSNGDVRIVELPGRSFFLGSLFQPELASDGTWVHPLITAFIAAVLAEVAGERQPA